MARVKKAQNTSSGANLRFEVILRAAADKLGVMVAIEGANKFLKAVLPKDYARPALDKAMLGEIIDLIGTIGLGDRENRSKDILGRIYE